MTSLVLHSSTQRLISSYSSPAAGISKQVEGLYGARYCSTINSYRIDSSSTTEQSVLKEVWVLVTPFTSGRTGGSWSNGSGYSCVTRATVYAEVLAPSVDMRYKADLCNYKEAYDEISRVSRQLYILMNGIFQIKVYFVQRKHQIIWHMVK